MTDLSCDLDVLSNVACSCWRKMHHSHNLHDSKHLANNTCTTEKCLLLETRQRAYVLSLSKWSLFDLSPRSAMPVTVTIAKTDIATVNGGRDSLSTTNRHVHSIGFYCYLPLSCAAISSLNILCSSTLILQPIYFSIIINIVSGRPSEVDTGISSLKTRPKSIYWDVLRYDRR